MSTVDKENKSTSVIENDAYELASCFADELQDLLYEIAENLAKRRNSTTPDGLTSIEKVDVYGASQIVISSLRDRSSRPDAPEGLAELVDDITGCVDSKVEK